mmetsp:Transcript_55753/g.90212  ORF Transcript_55753/g.90212 Transcript_55753/m.90212 type:complete len:251 (+) Transcript_55753:315-1067(+)
MTHLVLAYAATKSLYNVELDESLDKTIDVPVQHASELCNLLVLKVRSTTIFALIEENGIRRGELDQTSASSILHLEWSLLAAKEERDETHCTRHVVVRELHQVPASESLSTKACEQNLQHPQPQEASGPRLHPLVSFNARQQDVVYLMNIFQQSQNKLLCRHPPKDKSNFCQRLEANLVDIKRIWGPTGNDHSLNVVEDGFELLQGSRIKVFASGSGCSHCLPAGLEVLCTAGTIWQGQSPTSGDRGQPQ